MELVLTDEKKQILDMHKRLMAIKEKEKITVQDIAKYSTLSSAWLYNFVKDPLHREFYSLTWFKLVRFVEMRENKTYLPINEGVIVQPMQKGGALIYDVKLRNDITELLCKYNLSYTRIAQHVPVCKTTVIDFHQKGRKIRQYVYMKIKSYVDGILNPPSRPVPQVIAPIEVRFNEKEVMNDKFISKVIIEPIQAKSPGAPVAFARIEIMNRFYFEKIGIFSVNGNIYIKYPPAPMSKFGALSRDDHNLLTRIITNEYRKKVTPASDYDAWRVE